MRRLIILFNLLICLSINAQVNLVLNPSFEILDSCPTAWDQIEKAKNWKRMGTTLNPICSAGLLHTCCIYPANCGINAFTNGGTVYQFPRTGNGYCSVEIFPPPPLILAILILGVIR